MQTSQEQHPGQIYLLMGYLGSGKTTFIRSLLQNKQNKKYAVIQNQFSSGEMGIEQPLIMDESGVPFSSFLELPNGCICCSAKNDLIASIQYILSNTDVRSIVVETNGLADPAESIKQFWFDEEMKINGYLHSVISIFSAEKFVSVRQQELFQKEIVFANKALITFVDKVDEARVKEVEEYVMERNEECQIERNDKYDIVEFISGSSLFDIRPLNSIEQSMQQSQCSHHSCTHPSHSHNKNHHGINSIFLKGYSPLKSKQQIELHVGQLLWESNIKILRIKGVYCLENFENVYELQGVDDVFEVKQTKTAKEKYHNQTKVLVIVQNSGELNQNEDGLQDLLRKKLGIVNLSQV